MNTNNQQKEQEIKKFKGLGSVIAREIGCSPAYVRLILNEKREKKSYMARKIVEMAQNISSAIK